MAPEQRNGDTPDPRIDFYACGVILYEMLTGERPAGTELPSERNPAVTRALDDIFRRAYARLDKRFASAGEFLAALPSSSPASRKFRHRQFRNYAPGGGHPAVPTMPKIRRCRGPVLHVLRHTARCGRPALPATAPRSRNPAISFAFSAASLWCSRP